MLLMSLGTKYALSETMVKAIPLMLAGLAVSFAFRVKLWNIGAEGQLYMGALASSYVALFWSEGHSACTILPLMLIAAFIFAGLWGLIAGIFKAYWNVNETIVTLLMNYIAIFGVDYLVYGSWKDPANMGFPLTPRFSEAATLPTLGATRIHMGLLIALVIALLFFLLLRYSRWGYELRVLGDSPAAARYAGIDVRKNILMVMFISAGVAGIAGMIEVSGITHRLQTGFSPGYGYTAIIVAWLAHLHPLLIILVAFLFGALLVGGFGVQRAVRVRRGEPQRQGDGPSRPDRRDGVRQRGEPVEQDVRGRLLRAVRVRREEPPDDEDGPRGSDDGVRLRRHRPQHVHHGRAG